MISWIDHCRTRRFMTGSTKLMGCRQAGLREHQCCSSLGLRYRRAERRCLQTFGGDIGVSNSWQVGMSWVKTDPDALIGDGRIDPGRFSYGSGRQTVTPGSAVSSCRVSTSAARRAAGICRASGSFCRSGGPDCVTTRWKPRIETA